MSSVRTAIDSLEDIEIGLLLEGLYRVHGFDFREYSRASIKRRTLELMRAEKLETISAFQDKILHDSACLDRFLLGLSVHATAMFRDPSFYLTFREKVVAAAKNLSNGADLGGGLFHWRRSLFAGDSARRRTSLPKVPHLCHRH